jgi:hypothetical protein
VCTVQIIYVVSICIKGNTQPEGSTGLISELNYLSVLIACYIFRLLEKTSASMGDEREFKRHPFKITVFHVAKISVVP